MILVQLDPLSVMLAVASPVLAPLGIGVAILIVSMCVYCCYKCAGFRMRDNACVKRLFRCCGVDSFEDFEVMILVHEASYDQKALKMTTKVRLTAGDQMVETDGQSQGIFQQPISVFVEQGTSTILIELLDAHNRQQAFCNLDPLHDVLEKGRLGQLGKEQKFHMRKSKNSRLTKPTVSLTLVLDKGDDQEAGLLSDLGLSSDTSWLVRQQLNKAGNDQPLNEMQMLAQGCKGPLDLFAGLGDAANVYVAIIGPPAQRKWTLGVWKSERDFARETTPEREVEILKVRSVQPDPARSNVFFMNYFDARKNPQQLIFRRIDRAREVWVEMLSAFVQLAHAQHSSSKKKTVNA